MLKLPQPTLLRATRNNEFWKKAAYRYAWPAEAEKSPAELPPRTKSDQALLLIKPGATFMAHKVLYEISNKPSSSNPTGAAYQCLEVQPQPDIGITETAFIWTTYNGREYVEVVAPDTSKLSVVVEAQKITIGKVTVAQGKLQEYTKIGEQPATDIPDDIWVTQNRFKPPRSGNEATFYIDGLDAMEAIATAMLAAKKSIHITGFWISPDIIILGAKESSSNEATSERSLRSILKEKAQAGVAVRILLYDPPLDRGLGEDLVKTDLETECPGKIHVILLRPASSSVLIPSYWTHHQKTVVIDDTIAFLGGIDLTRGRRDTGKHSLNPQGTSEDNKYNPQSDNGPHGQNDIIRMPWHDIHLQLKGAAAVDVACNFVERWNSSPAAQFISTLGDPSYIGLSTTGPHTVQIARTLGTEKGIEEMYVNLISEAKSYIHIEQQFFSSLLKSDNTFNNLVVSAIAERLDKAIRSNESFRVYIIIPQYPEGRLSTLETREVIHWHYRTIIRKIPQGSEKEIDENSLYGRAIKSAQASLPGTQRSIADCMNFLKSYVNFFNLVSSESVGGTWRYSQIYVHAKMMIVDDRYALIGSANINDRSMLANRDTEIAALVADRTFARNLRVSLWREHLGLLEPSGWTDPERRELESLIEAPPSAKLHERILQIARANTSALESTFPGFPRDAFATLEQQKAAEALALGDSSALSQLRGRLTLFPLYWLRKEDLETTGYPDDAFQ